MKFRRMHLALVLVALSALVGVAVVGAQQREISVYPGDRYTDVSPGATINVYFPQSMDAASVESAFGFEPAVDGYFHWSSDNQQMQFRPRQPIAAKTVYRAVIGTGARTASGQQLLAQPYRWQFETSADTAKIGFGYRLPAQFVTPTGGRGVPIQPGYSRITIDYRLYSVDVATFLARYPQLKIGEANKIDPAGMTEVAAWQEYLDATDHAAKAALPKDTPPGLYLLDARADRVGEAQTFVIYSDYAVVAKRGTTGRLAWVTRIPDGQGVPGAEVTFYDVAGQPVGGGVTDADGLARFDEPSAHFVVATFGAHTTLVALDDNWYNSGYWYGWWGRGGWMPTPPEFAAHIHTDRPIYRPGHTVHYKATVRRLVGDDFVVADASTPITVTIKDVTGNTVSTDKPALDAFGSLAGDLKLGEDASLGNWQIHVEVGGQDIVGSFAVQEYVKPDYAVVVETDKPFYVTGDQVTVKVQADYYFGQPVAGAEVTLRVFRDYYYWYSREGNQVTEMKGTTGPDGSWTTTMTLTVDAERTYAQYYYFEAEVTDASRRPVVEEGSAPVYPAAFDLQLEAERYGIEVGQPYELTVRTIGHDGRPVPGRAVEVSIQQWRWQESRGSWYEVIKREQATTGADGSAVVTFRDIVEGWYEIQARAIDDAGHVAKAQSWAWFFRGDRPWYWNGGLEMKADRDAYAPGDTALLLIKSPYTTTTTALLTIERENVYDEFVVPLQGAATVEIPIHAGYAPNVWVRLHVWEAVRDTHSQSEARMVTAMLNLSVPATDQRLSVVVAPDAPTHGPHEQATFTVSVTDAAGAPVDAQLSFALVDKAVLALADDTSGDIFDAFWSDRSDTVGIYHSLEPTNWYSYPNYAEDGQRGAPGGQPPAPAAPTSSPSPGEKSADDEQSPAQPRREFPDTAYWNATLTTGPDGVVDVTLTLPDTLTTWKALVRAVTIDTKVGQGAGELIVTKPVIADAALPRFAVQGDQFALDVLGRNYVGGELQATVTLDTPGLVQLDPGVRNLALPFNETKFARWSVVASDIGINPVTAWVRTPAGEDGVELPLEVQPFAVPDRFARAGSTDGTIDETFDVPFNAVPDGSSVEVRLASGMALGVLDGLEELIGYPYGCVEQTMSRMLPNAVIGRLLKVLEIEAPEITTQLPEMMALGLQKLYGFQNPNGSWGWWHWQYSEGNVYTTAYVLHGLTLTRQAGFEVDPAVLTRGFAWLTTASAAETDPRIQAYAAYVLGLGGQGNAELTVRLFDRRSEMDAFALSALAIALDDAGRTDLSDQVLDLLESTVAQTVTTASWPVNWDDRRYYWYYWYAMSNTEKNTAMALDALSLLRPESPLAPKAARWLMENRWGSGWRTTQGTAFAVMGLTDYIIASGELDAEYDWTVALDGTELARGTVNRDNLTQRIPPIVIAGSDLTPGSHTITLSRAGRGSLFYTVLGRMALYYDGFEPTAAAGLGVNVTREYAKVAGRGGEDGWAVGDVVNVRLTVDLTEEMRYLIVEDMMPAGFEPLNEQLNTESKRVPEEPGYPYYWRWWGYERKEMRDERVTFFGSYLTPGKHTFDYAARVVTPGIFSARPAEAYTMYRPEVWGRSASDQVIVARERVADRPDLAGDYDRDCRLTGFDASLIADQWDKGGKRDVNNDGRIDVADIATAGGRSGLSCGQGVPLPPGPAGNMGIALRAPDQVDQGQTFDLDIVADGAGNVGAYELTLALPAGAFEVVGLKSAERLPDARLLGPVVNAGTVRLGGFAPQGTDGSGARVLARLTLRALRAGDASIQVSAAQIVTDHGGAYRVTANGVVVSPAPWTPRGMLYLPSLER